MDQASSSRSTEGPLGTTIAAELPKFRRGLALYGYQIESLEWILRAERDHQYHDAHGRIALTEPFGSGKTFIILALIMRSPIPPITHTILHEWIAGHPYMTFMPTHPNQIIRPTAVVVARSVYAQWVRNIETYTSLRLFEARDRPTTHKLINMIINGDINDYDIVLVKYGKTHTGFENHELCKIINGRTIPLIWSRVIYDDIDLIIKSMCMRAISSLFVTGATNFTFWSAMRFGNASYEGSREAKRGSQQYELRDVLVKLPPVGHVFGRNGNIWATLGHSPDLIAQNHGVYAIRWLMGLIANTEIHRASGLIRDIEAVDCSELLEMIHSDAMISAARSLHISVVSPSAMFAGVLGVQRQSYEIVRMRMIILERIMGLHVEQKDAIRAELRDIDETCSGDGSTVATAQRGIVRTRLGLSEPQIEKAESHLEIKTGAQQRAGTGIDAMDRISSVFHTMDLLTTSEDDIRAMFEQLRAYLERLDRSFLRISENLSEQTCLVCYEPLQSSHITIMRCCGFTICATCCAQASQFHRTADSRIVGVCVQCRQQLDIAKDVIFVESGNDASELIRGAIENKGSGDVEERSNDAASGSGSGSDSGHNRAAQSNVSITTKIAYVISLISGQLRGLPEKKGDSMNVGTTLRVRNADMPEIRGVMNGTQLVLPENDQRMFLICTSFDETIEDISVALTEHDINHAVLHGSIHDFASILDRFTRREVRVLIVNIRALYAGVDLQCATDLILVSRTDVENIGQIVGRAQRLGRTCSLTVHSLDYVSSTSTSSANDGASSSSSHSRKRWKNPRRGYH